MEEAAAELKRMIGVFLNIDRNTVIKCFEVEDEAKNLKLFDKICENLKKIEPSKDFILKFDGFDIRSVFGCFKMFVPSLNSKDSFHLVSYLEAFENISAYLAGSNTDPKKNVCIVERDLSFEHQLYTQYFKNSKSKNIFPRMISYVVDQESKKVLYIFEKMTELLGGGSLGLFFEGQRYHGPKIRDQHPCYLILDAINLTMHVLYGLYVLHEEFGIVHADISPSNIMFSEVDDIWKLHDFQTAMLLKDSLKTERKGVSTRGFTCPVAERTGIYDKSSDIYSIGKVLSSVFLARLKRQVDQYGKQLHPDTCQSVYELINIAEDMTKPVPSERPDIKIIMFRLYALFQYNLLEDFNVYGRKMMTPRIESLLFDKAR